jgi:hyperosmotically inducible protein
MKKLPTFVLTGVLLLGAFACSDVSKTSSDAPNSTEEVPATPDAETVENSQQDAQSQVRRDQLNSDIRAREERDQITGGSENRTEDDLESEVRSKLEANIPKSQLAVEATEDGTVTVSGTLPNEQDLQKIEPLAKQIRGVKAVVNKVTYAPPTAQ